jgi:cell fate (sporulation/competence/biofilm development) regulator YmcA (YheA/YmcA/DUF963 family)
MMNLVDQRAAILSKAHQIVNMLQNSEEMQRFRQASDKLERHAAAQALMFIVKAKRNAFSQTSLRYGYDHPASIKAKQEYEAVLEQIAQIPLIEEYRVAQEELNDIIQGILQTVVNTVSDVLPVEKSADPGPNAKGGCGNCSSGGCGRH